jgi:hypothetical protein
MQPLREVMAVFLLPHPNPSPGGEGLRLGRYCKINRSTFALRYVKLTTGKIMSLWENLGKNIPDRLNLLVKISFNL